MARIIDWDDEPYLPYEPYALKEQAELLVLVQYWRERAEEAEELLQYLDAPVD